VYGPGVTDSSAGHLEVTLSGRDRPEQIPLTEGVPMREELARFLNRQGPYAQLWIRLSSGEYVRYDLIESVRAPALEPDS
jgi:hypothetical protein